MIKKLIIKKLDLQKDIIYAEKHRLLNYNFKSMTYIIHKNLYNL